MEAEWLLKIPHQCRAEVDCMAHAKRELSAQLLTIQEFWVVVLQPRVHTDQGLRASGFKRPATDVVLHVLGFSSVVDVVSHASASGKPLTDLQTIESRPDRPSLTCLRHLLAIASDCLAEVWVQIASTISPVNRMYGAVLKEID